MTKTKQFEAMSQEMASRYGQKYIETGDEFWLGMLKALRTRIEAQ